MKIVEILGTVSVIAVLIVIPFGIVVYQHDYIIGDSKRVITLTGVGKDGVWTLETVNSGNYWRKKFKRATLYLRKGEKITLRLNSADTHHRFYAPALNIGPIDVEAGHTETVDFRAETPGTYRYYCTSICGECHFYMRGWIIVLAKGEKAGKVPPITMCSHTHKPKKPTEKNMLAWGRYLYKTLGCETCHGIDGRGGVKNFNSIKQTVPNHNKLASRLFLEDKDAAAEFIKLLTSHTNLDNAASSTEIPRYRLVLAQYRSAKEIIKKGKLSGILNPKNPKPPLNMPAWQDKLREKDIDAVIAYLIKLGAKYTI